MISLASTAPSVKSGSACRLSMLAPLRAVPSRLCACVRVCVSPWCWWCCWRNRGATAATKGTAFVVYEDIYDAKNAVEHLSGFNVCGRYLIVLYYQPKRAAEKREIEKEKAELEALKKKYGVGTDAEDAQAR